jgi:hypothetical protein
MVFPGLPRMIKPLNGMDPRFILAIHQTYMIYIPDIDLYSIMGHGIYWVDSIADWCLRI